MILITILNFPVISNKSFQISIFELTNCFIYFFLVSFNFSRDPFSIKRILKKPLKVTFRAFFKPITIFNAIPFNIQTHFLFFLQKFLYKTKTKRIKAKRLQVVPFKLKQKTQRFYKKKRFEKKKNYFKSFYKIRKGKLLSFLTFPIMPSLQHTTITKYYINKLRLRRKIYKSTTQVTKKVLKSFFILKGKKKRIWRNFNLNGPSFNITKLSYLGLKKIQNEFTATIKPKPRYNPDLNIYKLSFFLFTQNYLIRRADYSQLKLFPYRTFKKTVQQKKVFFKHLVRLNQSNRNEFWRKNKVINKKNFVNLLTIFSKKKFKNLTFFITNHAFKSNVISWFLLSPKPIFNSFLTHEWKASNSVFLVYLRWIKFILQKFYQPYFVMTTQQNTLKSNFIKSFTCYNIKSSIHKTKLIYWNEAVEYNEPKAVNKVRFTPGYIIMWKKARFNFKLFHNLNFRYQKKLTKYLLIKKANILTNPLLNIFNIKFILNYLMLFKSEPLKKFLLENEFIFINGYQVKSSDFLINANDLISIIIFYNFFFLLKIDVLIFKKRKFKIKKWYSYIYKRHEYSFFKKKKIGLPSKFLKYNDYFHDMLNVFEFDFLNMQGVLLYSQWPFEFLNREHLYFKFTNIYRNYNWKFIT